MSESQVSHLFISYSRRDKDHVARLSEQLEEAGAKVWMDTSGIQSGSDWWKSISEAIDDAEAFVCFLSPSFLESPTCQQEVRRAHEAGKQVVPVRIDDVNIPQEFAWLSLIQWIDATSNPDSFAHGVLVAASSDPHWSDLHRHLLLQSQRWEKNGRRRRHLLRGADVETAESEIRTPRRPGQPQASRLIREFVASSRRASRSRTRWATALAAVVLLGALSLSAYATVKKQQAQEQRAVAEEALSDAKNAEAEANAQRASAEQASKEALSSQLVAEAGELVTRSLTETDPLSALLLAIEAEMRTPVPLSSAREAWAQAVRRYGATTATVRDSTRFEAGYSRSTWSNGLDRVAALDSSQRLLILTPNGSMIGDALSGPYLNVEWAPDDRVLVAQQDSGYIDVVSPDGELLADDVTQASEVIGWSPDGGRVALSRDGDLVLLDTGSWASTVVAVGETYVPKNLWEAVWSPRGDRIAVRYNVPVNESQVNEGGFQVFDSAGVPQSSSHLSEGYDGLRPLVWLGTGQSIAVPTIEGQIHLLDASGSTMIGSIETGSENSVLLAGNGDGGLASANADGTILLFSASGALATKVTTGDGLGPEPIAVQWSPLSNSVAVGFEDGRIEIFGADAKPIGDPVVPTTNEALLSLRWARSGDQLIAEYSPYDEQVLSVTTQDQRVDSLLVADKAASVDWHGSDDRLAIGFPDWSISIYDHATGALTAVGEADFDMPYPHRGDTDGIEWSPDGTRLALRTTNGAAAIVDPSLRQSITLLSYQDDDGGAMTSWSPDSTHLGLIANGVASVYDARTGELALETPSQGYWEIGLLKSAIATVGNDGLHILNADSERVVPDSAGVATGLVVAPGGESFAVIREDDRLWVFNEDDYENPVTIDAQLGSLSAVSWSPSGDLLALGGSDGSLRVVDRRGEGRGDAVSTGEERIVRLEWNGDDSVLAVVDDKARMSYVVVGAESLSAPVDAGALNTVATSWSADGTSLARVLTDGSVVIDHAWTEAEICKVLIAQLGPEELDRRVGGAAGSVCVSGKIQQLPMLPAAARRNP